ncbi:MAG: ATP-binding protein, partial [Planctomycetaceae bacterium]|nr:ATP-binding protein [Planctomycetaceae bacterium]
SLEKRGLVNHYECLRYALRSDSHRRCDRPTADGFDSAPRPLRLTSDFPTTMPQHDTHQRTDGVPASPVTSANRADASLDRLRELSLPHVDLGTCPPEERMDRLKAAVAPQFVLIIGNDLRLVPILVDGLSQKFVDFGICDRSTAGRLGVAVGEAVVNAIVHGNLEVGSEIRDDPGDLYDKLIEARRLDARFRRRRVRLICDFDSSQGRITVRDEGPGFDVASVPDPTRDENLSRPYGRGILLIRAFFDDVYYSAEGNAVTMIKRGPKNSRTHSSGT